MKHLLNASFLIFQFLYRFTLLCEKRTDYQEDTISPFPHVSLWEMISLFSFISSSPMMVIDLGQREQREID